MSTRTHFNTLRCRDAESDSCDILGAGIMRAGLRTPIRRTSAAYLPVIGFRLLDPSRAVQARSGHLSEIEPARRDDDRYNPVAVPL
jgi:hypothetical protein